MEIRILSSMAKVFPDEIPARCAEHERFSALAGETVAFQIAWRDAEGTPEDIRLRVEGSGTIRLSAVEDVYCEKPVGAAADADYLRVSPGVYPDPLEPLNESGSISVTGSWKSALVEAEDLPAGKNRLRAVFTRLNGEVIGDREIVIDVSPVSLAPQRLKYTRWFHADALAQTYGVPVFSEDWWTIAENFLRAARKQGMNMVLTPIHTPPLDTGIGAERLTAQLVGISATDGGYRFRFDLLDRWVGMCLSLGFEYFEMAHLYTQWGAKAAPKIIADGKKRFGWETDALSPEYADFLAQYLTALDAHLKSLGIADRCVFHISDEPTAEQADAYLAAKRQAEPYLKGYTIMDALSDVSLYRSGTVSMPVPSNDHAADFEGEPLPERWTYYCCAQTKDVSNSFIAMPGERTRVLGVQLYRRGYTGFLQWGLNYYYAEHSRRPINPYLHTDGVRAWPAGDPFILYPGTDRMPRESLRAVLTREAVQDYRALDALEAKIGRNAVCALIDETAGGEPSFTDYPRNECFLLTLRERIGKELEK